MKSMPAAASSIPPASPAVSSPTTEQARGALSPLPPSPPAADFSAESAPALCAWMRGELQAGRAAEALRHWEDTGNPLSDSCAVLVTASLLAAETGRWGKAREWTFRVLAREPENPMAAGLGALAAFHSGDLPESARLFKRHGLFAATPLVRLFLWTFAERVRMDPSRYPWQDGLPTSDSSKEPASPAPGPDSDSSVQRPIISLWRQLILGGGVGQAARAKVMTREADRHFMRRELAQARRAYLEAAALTPEEWIPPMAAEFCRIDAGGSEAETARAKLIEIASRFPDVPLVASASAYACYASGRFREGLALLSTLSPAGPDDWGANYLSALCLKSLGREREADQALRIALGPFFIDTWEQFVMPLFARVIRGLERNPSPALKHKKGT